LALCLWKNKYQRLFYSTLQDSYEISADLRKAEIFINNRASSVTADGSWVGWENYRFVV
jgi:hypothetical protein